MTASLALRFNGAAHPAWPHERVVAKIAKERGRHFDPRVVSALLDVVAVEVTEGVGATVSGALSDPVDRTG